MEINSIAHEAHLDGADHGRCGPGGTLRLPQQPRQIDPSSIFWSRASSLSMLGSVPSNGPARLRSMSALFKVVLSTAPECACECRPVPCFEEQRRYVS